MIARRIFSALLYALFSGFLLIPLIRRWRRARWWQYGRVGAAAAGAALIALGGAVLQVSGVALLIGAALLGRVEDPDRLRKIAEALGSRHIVNGGSLLLFLNTEEMLVTSAGRPEKVIERLPLAALESIQLEGEEYKPRYISFAKAPPVRESNPDRAAACNLSLRFAGSTLQLVYRGVFARHLAEIAAHTLYDMRKLPLKVIQ